MHERAVAMTTTPSLHLCHVFSTFGAGGAQVRTARIINALGRAFRHTIVAADERYDAASYLNSDAAVACVRPPPGKGRYTWALSLRRMLADLSPDVLVTYNWGAMDAVVAAQLGPLCPVLHTEDGFGPDEAAGLKWRRVMVRRLALRRVHGIVVPSRTLAAIAERRYRIAAARIAYIPNGVDTGRFRPDGRSGWRSTLGIPSNAVVFGTAGRLRAEKNLGLLIRAFARAKADRAWLVVVGDGECRAEWEALARTVGAAQRIRFVGETRDPAPYYAGFDVFAMSSITEQMPMALLEAMASGLPAICTDVGDTGEMLGPATGQIVPLDPDSYTAAILRVTRDAQLRQSLGAANRARCVERYSADRMVQMYRAAYEAAARDR